MVFGIVLVGIIVIFYYMYCFHLKRLVYIVRRVNELPGKRGNLILGNILDIWGSQEEVYRKLSSVYKEHSRNGILRLWMGLFPYVMIANPDVAERILRNPINNNKGIVYNPLRPWLNDGLLTSVGQKWHGRRKLLTPSFHFNVLQQFLIIFNKESKFFIENLRGRVCSEIDVTSAVSKFTLNTICETAMGISLNEHQEEGEKYRSSINEFGGLVVQRVVKTWLLVEPIFRLSKAYLKQIEIMKVLHGFSRQVIDARKINFSADRETNKDEYRVSSPGRKQAMLDLLITAQNRGENIDDEGIQEEVDTFVFEGHDTTAASLAFSLMVLANNIKCQEKIYEELKSVFGDDDRDPTNADLQKLRYLECCIKESLRLYPSVPKIGRKLGEDIQLENGRIIPKDCSIFIMIQDMHMRADLYPDPEKFDPDRFLPENTSSRHPYAYIPFSAGPRNCIGQKFAMMEMKCLLSTILRNFILEPVDTPKTVVCLLDMVLRTKNPIRVKFLPRADNFV